MSKRKKIVALGMFSTILGVLGYAACCLPIVGSIFAVLGISLLFVHQVSVIFVVLGLVILIIGIFLIFNRRQSCKKK